MIIKMYGKPAQLTDNIHEIVRQYIINWCLIQFQFKPFIEPHLEVSLWPVGTDHHLNHDPMAYIIK